MKSYRLVIAENAAKEYNSAYWYYEEQQQYLGLEFEQEVNKLFLLITKNPLLFARKFKRYREALLDKFPFFVVYEVMGQNIVVHSLFHTSKNPKKKYSKK